MEVLTEMIERGWGDTPQALIPENWREIEGPRVEHAKGPLRGYKRRKSVFCEDDPKFVDHWWENPLDLL